LSQNVKNGFRYNDAMERYHETTTRIIKKLTENRQSVTCAESCTGGRIAAAITSVSGASAVFHGSVVTYSNEIKHLWLGVDEEILNTYGAVSRQCVEQMLTGVIHLAGADYAIAVSGIAGPTGGTPEKPVGTVYIGIQTPFSQEVFQCFFHGSREQIQNQSVAFALEKLAELLDIS
jgi:nicotinamide-nucleotide amidase